MRLYGSLSVIILLAVVANGEDAVSPTSAPATVAVRDAAGFRPRTNVEHLIQDRRTQDEDKLRAALLACAQSDDELRTLTAMVNGRWDKKCIETLGQWLAEDWDKEYGPSLRRPKCIFELLVYVRNKPPAPQALPPAHAKSNFLSVKTPQAIRTIYSPMAQQAKMLFMTAQHVMLTSRLVWSHERKHC